MKTVLCIGALAAALASSCVSFRFDRATVNVPPKQGVLARLSAGETTLASALDALGAPLYVWEYKGDGLALAWGWSEDASRGLSLSIPLDQGGSATASYDDLARHLRGVVLFFGPDLALESMREGFLNELRPAIDRKRPAPVAEPAAAD